MVNVLVWVVGLVVLVLLALSDAKIHGPSSGQTAAFAQGYAFGTLAVALAIGLGGVFLIGRIRRSAGHPSPNWAWALLLAAGVMVIPLTASAGGVTPTATATNGTTAPASAYLDIAAPYALFSPTSGDAALVSKIQSDVGKDGFTDVRVRRIVGADQSLLAYFIVAVGPDTSSDPQGAMAGLLEGLRSQSLSPSVTTLDGQSVAIINLSGAWTAAWLDGRFSVEVVNAHDEATASALAKAVLDAR